MTKTSIPNWQGLAQRIISDLPPDIFFPEAFPQPRSIYNRISDDWPHDRIKFLSIIMSIMCLARLYRSDLLQKSCQTTWPCLKESHEDKNRTKEFPVLTDPLANTGRNNLAETLPLRDGITLELHDIWLPKPSTDLHVPKDLNRLIHHNSNANIQNRQEYVPQSWIWEVFKTILL